MNLPSTRHWLIKAIALALVVPIPVAVMAYAATYVAGMEDRSTENAAFLVFLVVPPLWLMALVILGRAEMDIGFGEEPKGELECLLEKKHLGVLRDQPRQVKSRPEHPVKPAAPMPNPVAAESGPVLDRLLDWQRRKHPRQPHDPDYTD